METRLEHSRAAPGALEVMSHLERYTRAPALLELVKMRASQINGCAYFGSYQPRKQAPGRA